MSPCAAHEKPPEVASPVRAALTSRSTSVSAARVFGDNPRTLRLCWRHARLTRHGGTSVKEKWLQTLACAERSMRASVSFARLPHLRLALGQQKHGSRVAVEQPPPRPSGRSTHFADVCVFAHRAQPAWEERSGGSQAGCRATRTASPIAAAPVTAATRCPWRPTFS